MPVLLEDIEQAQSAKLLGIVFHSNFSSVNYDDNVPKLRSQRIFLLNRICDQGPPRHGLRTVFQPSY